MEVKIHMSIEIFDPNGVIIALCKTAESCKTREQAFLIENAMSVTADGNTRIELLDKLNLSQFESDVSRGSINFAPEFLITGIRACAKSGRAYILAHTHPHPSDAINVHFSLDDQKFEQAIAAIAKKEKFNLPILFLLGGCDSFVADVYENGRKTGDFKIDFPFEGKDVGRPNLHFIRNGKTGVAYYAPANKIVQLDPKTTGAFSA